MASTVTDIPELSGTLDKVWEIKISYVTYTIKNYKVLLCHIARKHKAA